MVTRWLASWAAPGDAPVRLFCLAHAGGGSTFFRGWRPALRPRIDVCPVVLPGRESRFGEPLPRRMGELVPALAAAIAPCADRPYAVFGHSLGAVIAYELARALPARGAPEPLCLVVSARVPPHVPPTRQALHGLPREEFLDALGRLGGMPRDVLDDPELVDLLLPILRSDIELNETYRPLPGPRLGCPVFGLAASDDPEVGVPEMERWREVTDGPFELRVFAGDHFYLAADEARVVATVAADVLALAPTR